jgi:rhodanese-related sulfurtransferase
MRTVNASEIQAGSPTLIDVREYPEFAAGFIRGAQLVPLPKWPVALALGQRMLPWS